MKILFNSKVSPPAFYSCEVVRLILRKRAQSFNLKHLRSQIWLGTHLHPAELLALLAAFSSLTILHCAGNTSWISLFGGRTTKLVLMNRGEESEGKCFRADPGSSPGALIFHKMGHKVCAGLRWSATSKCWSTLKDANLRWSTQIKLPICKM